MNTENINKQVVNFKKARDNLLLVVLLTTVNLLLQFFGSNWNFAFSASIPTIIFGILEHFSPIVALLVSLSGAFLYLLFYILSKKKRVFILVSLILFSIDTVVFLILTLLVGLFGFGFSIIEIAIHAWVMYYLIIGTIAWSKLRNVSQEEFDLAREAVMSKTETDEIVSALDGIEL